LSKQTQQLVFNEGMICAIEDKNKMNVTIYSSIQSCQDSAEAESEKLF